MKLRDVRKQVNEWRGMDVAALQAELAKLKKEQFNLRFQQATGQLEKISRFGEVRDQIARLKTLITQKTPAKTA